LEFKAERDAVELLVIQRAQKPSDN
jgi:hypothetical protein